MPVMVSDSRVLFPTKSDGENVPNVIAVVGPTATGKSDLAVALSIEIDAEIINADAMQLYRGMDIGTAKLSLSERRGVPHHQLDVLNITENANVATYQGAARGHIVEITDRGHRALLVGGSALYLRAALDQLDFPGTDPTLREYYEQRLADKGAEALHSELAALDPLAAEQILPTNLRRIVRALEVIELTGRPFTATLPQYQYHAPAIQIGLEVPTDVLLERIKVRVHRMWDEGLLNEIDVLVEQGINQGRTAKAAVGYAEALAHRAGIISREEAIEQTIIATRRLARRQEKWFKKDPRVHWLKCDDPALIERALELIEKPDTLT